jgi:hypothetical protein
MPTASNSSKTGAISPNNPSFEFFVYYIFWVNVVLLINKSNQRELASYLFYFLSYFANDGRVVFLYSRFC